MHNLSPRKLRKVRRFFYSSVNSINFPSREWGQESPDFRFHKIAKKKNPPIRPWWFQIHRRMTGHVCRQIRHSGHSLGMRSKRKPVITGFSRCPPSGRVGKKESRRTAGWGRSGQRTTKNAVRHRRMQQHLHLLSLSLSLLPSPSRLSGSCCGLRFSLFFLLDFTGIESVKWRHSKSLFPIFVLAI